MSPLERLLEESVPTRPQPAEHRGPWSEKQQDTHWNDLCHAVGTPGKPRPSHTTT